MIRPLRQKHRVVLYGLCLLLPVGLATGLAARRPVPVAAQVPSELTGRPGMFDQVVWTKRDLWPGSRIITSLRRDQSGAVAMELWSGDLVKPDVLLYWAAGREWAGQGLSKDARLLGSLSSRSPIVLPAEVRGTTGRFVLYSLADQELVSTTQPFIVQKD
jgi:hypothetical protein